MSNRLCERHQRKILRIRVPSQILERWMPAFGSKGDVRLSFKRPLLLPEHQTPIRTRSPPRELRTARETKRPVVQRYTM